MAGEKVMIVVGPTPADFRLAATLSFILEQRSGCEVEIRAHQIGDRITVSDPRPDAVLVNAAMNGSAERGVRSTRSLIRRLSRSNLNVGVFDVESGTGVRPAALDRLGVPWVSHRLDQAHKKNLWDFVAELAQKGNT